MEHIYLDHAATTPVHPVVAEKMMSLMMEKFGNPSSVHFFGRQTREALDEARKKVAKSIAAKEKEITFTSGGTEADNIALMGAAMANRDKGNHIITTSIEHHAVLHTCEYLESQGFEVTYLPVNEDGRISMQSLNEAVTDQTILVSIMYGNNEVGTLQPIEEIGEFLNEQHILFHTDAVQAYGICPINVSEMSIDMLSASSHKINGPKGVGFLYVKDGVKLSPLFYGGEQERKRRAGTENVPGIVGFMYAANIMMEQKDNYKSTYLNYKEKMISIFDQEKINYYIHADNEETLPHVFNVSFPGINVESMLVNLDLAGVAVSSGSACTAGSIDPSHVLVAMYGQGSEHVKSSIRFSFGYGNTMGQIEQAASETAKIVKRLVK